jgi:ATP-dependent protease ClpP protease subunit
VRKALLAAALLAAARPAGAMRYEVALARAASGRAVNVVRATGFIGRVEFGAWQEALSRVDPSLDTLFVVASPGGDIAAGIMLLSRVEDFQKSEAAGGRRVGILLSGDCASMCVPVYFMFDRRYAAAGARLGLHGASFGQFGFDRQQTDLYLDRMKSKAAERGDALTPRFLDEQASRGVFASTDLTYFDAADLAARASGLVASDAVVADEQAAIDRLAAGR